MFNEELASHILQVLNRSFPDKVSVQDLISLLPDDRMIPRPDWLKAIDALMGDGLVRGKALRGSFEQLEDAAGLVITSLGRERIRKFGGRDDKRPRDKTESRKVSQGSDAVFETAFERYRIANPLPLGSGGSGLVFDVTDQDGTHLALKVLNVGVDSKKVKRFRNEISFCSNKSHPNIIKVLDYGVSQLEGKSRPFYVMPLYATTLRAMIFRKLTAADVLRLFALMLDGVEAAHLLEVIHRDLKPENVLCDGDAKALVIADFGIARFKEEDLHTAVETHNRERLANFLYSAPEQRERGKEVDGRADIFALGLMLNEMFTGQVPQGAGFKHIAEVSPEHAYLDGLVDEMRQQDPSRRPNSVKEIKLQLLARGREFVSLQKLDRLKTTVIPESAVDDCIVARPITLVGVDWDSGKLKLKLSQVPNEMWIRTFVGLRSYSALVGKEPPRFTFTKDEAEINASAGDAQITVDNFKQYLFLTNTGYATAIESAKRREIDERTRALRQQIENEEKNLKTKEWIQKNIKI